MSEKFEWKDTAAAPNEAQIVAQRRAAAQATATPEQEAKSSQDTPPPPPAPPPPGQDTKWREGFREAWKNVSLVGTFNKIFLSTLFNKTKAAPLDETEKQQIDEIGRVLDEKYHIKVLYMEEAEAIALNYNILDSKGRWDAIKTARAARKKRDAEEKTKKEQGASA